MNLQKMTLFTLTSLLLLSGCASYRVDSNIDIKNKPIVNQTKQIIISEKGLSGQQYQNISPIEVSVKKLTAGHKNPTKQQANEALIERARYIGADAVINVKYKSGIGFTTWGYMDAKGMGVKFIGQPLIRNNGNW